MISFGAAKPKVDLADTERIKNWANAALLTANANADADVRAHRISLSADVTIMVAEIQCREEGCAPVETVISFLEKSNPQKVSEPVEQFFMCNDCASLKNTPDTFRQRPRTKLPLSGKGGEVRGRRHGV
jgi:hypothetical protein